MLDTTDFLGSAVALGQSLAERRVTAEELLDAQLARVRRLNGLLNAIVTLDEEGARAAAREADRRYGAGAALGPLDGVPITVKDSIAVKNVRTTSGSPLLAQHVPASDADAVARLRAAGAVIFGKTNLSMMAGDFQASNPLFGRTNNPWDLARTPGGSSGGSAAAVAAGLSALELGSDIGGSVRCPAHFCGLYSHKPSFEVIPQRGHIPPPPGVLSTVDMGTLGPIARSAEDLAAAFEALVTPTAVQSYSWAPLLANSFVGGLAGRRIALWCNDDLMPVDDETGTLLDEVGRKLELSGCEIDRTARPDIDLAVTINSYATLLMPLLGAGASDQEIEALAATSPSLPHAARLWIERLIKGRSCSLSAYVAAKEVQARDIAAWSAFFRNVDVLICPVMPTAAFLHREEQPSFARVESYAGRDNPYWDQILWCGAFANFAHLPATVRPIRQSSEGLPMGIQIVGPSMGDRMTIHFAALMDDLFGRFAAPPIILAE